MKVICFVLCFLLVLNTLFSFNRMTRSANSTSFVSYLISTTFDIAILLLFAIVEKGRF